MVFLSSSCRETAKNAIKTKRREETTGEKFFFFFSTFWQNLFDMDFLRKFFWCFRTPLVEKHQKHAIKKSQELNKKLDLSIPPFIYSGYLLSIQGAPRKKK
jgi:hypothetical protein